MPTGFSHVTIALGIALAVAPLAAAQPNLLSHGAPAASWIAPPNVASDSFVVFHARRTFDLASVPTRFVVHVSADNRYRLYVNGDQVSSGPQRSDVAHWRYETVDLARNLRVGRNVIAALVWNWGPARPVAQHSHRTGFLDQGASPTDAAANTGAGWRPPVAAAHEVVPGRDAVGRGHYSAPPAERVRGAPYPGCWAR